VADGETYETGKVSEPPDKESSVLSKRLVVFLFSMTLKMVHNNAGNVSQVNPVKTLKIN